VTKKTTYLENLNSVQERAVRHGDGPLLVLAGAGSGKTRVLTRRIAYLIEEKDISPRRILAVTFTNKAAGEMKKRITEMLSREVALPWVGTFHSMCARLLRIEADWGWWTRDFTIYDMTDQVDLIKNCMGRLGISTTTFTPKSFLGEISRAKDILLTAEDYASRAGNHYEQTAARVYAEYEKGLRENNAFDFDDLIKEVVQLLRREPELGRSYAERFLYVLVDEYQDTSHAQYALVNLLSSVHRNICVVGDDDQSIYGWRGADITNILDFESDHPDAVTLRLEQNYRSTAGILAAAHDVVSNNERRKEKELWTEREEGAPVRFTRVSNEYQEADEIRDLVLTLVSKRGLQPREFAILYRTHAQSRVIEDSLRRAGIAYDIIGGVRFYERSEVKDVLAYLKVIINPADAVSLRRIVNVPPRKIGDKTIERLEAFALDRGVPLYEALGMAGEIVGVGPAARTALGELRGMFDRLRRKVETTPVNVLLDEVLDGSGYVAWLDGRRTEDTAQRLANVEELVSASSEFVEMSGEESLGAFLEQVSLVADIDRWEGEANTVSLMTLHNAKGLEFPIVLIPGMEDGLLPHESSFEDDEEMEEERRLCYVGMTRAMNQLHLFSADTRRRGGATNLRSPSRFIYEIDEAHLETVSTAVEQKWASRPGGAYGMRGRGGAGGRGSVGRGAGRGAGARGDAGRRGGSPGYRTDGASHGVFPDYENQSQEAVNLAPGARVQHPSWGEGVVVGIAGYGGDTVVTVRFDEAGGVEKRIMLRYGKLAPVI